MSIKQFIKRLFMHKFFYGNHKIRSIGKDVTLPVDIKILGDGQHVFIGNNVSIGKGAIFMCTNANIEIEDNVVASHCLTIITGDHERRVGMFCNSITEELKNKSIGLDQDVRIESDVWIGYGVTILKGVTISRGTTLSTGAVVNKTTLPYSIYGGVPAKFIKFYWTIDQIIEHEARLYPEEKRFTRIQLSEIFKENPKQHLCATTD